MQECVFCKIISGQIPADKQYEDEDVFAFNDIKPQAPVHVLVVPKTHIDNVAAASPEQAELIGKCHLVAAKIAKAKGLTGFRILNANGKEGGQTVFHLHYHLVGGWKNILPDMEVNPNL